MVNKNVKPLFRSNTQVIISFDFAARVLESINLLGGGRVLLMSDKQIVNTPSFMNMQVALEKSNCEVFEHFLKTKEPDVVWVDEQVEKVRDFKPDIILGIGGGSLIDLAKAVSVLIYNAGSAAEYQGPNLVKKIGAKKIMVPSTAGTGSEVTPGAVVVNYETGRKGAIGSPFITPDITILEPSLTLTMPEIVMASTAMDALTHCLESYVGKAENPFATMHAREGFRYLANAFPRVIENPNDMKARMDMLIGSCMAGFAIFNTDTGACHSLAYPLGTYHNVPHGIANALIIPLVIEHNIKQGAFKYAELYNMIEDRDQSIKDPEKKSLALIKWLRNLTIKTNLPINLRNYGITRDHINDLSKKGLNLKTALENNPVPFELTDSFRILESLVP